MKQQGSHPRTGVFVVLCVGAFLLMVVFGVFASRRSRTSNKEAVAPSSPVIVAPVSPAQSETNPSTPVVATRPDTTSGRKLIYFRTTALGSNYGKLAVAPLDAPDKVRYSKDLSCDRVYFAAGSGICLASDRGVFTNYYATKFDSQFQRGWTIPLAGVPSRVRLSNNGKLASITVFVSGHSYASVDFSTQTLIVDVEGGKVVADLEKFSVSKDNEAFQAPDFNFWGVSFLHDENRFYATLASKHKTYLVEGDVAKRTAKVIYEGVECPSVSPDNQRIAFKKRSGTITWGIALLDLKTLTETPLAEPHSVDDQVEWLDNDHVLYALSENPNGSSASTDIWSIPARANAAPQIFLKGAYSPAVVTNPN